MRILKLVTMLLAATALAQGKPAKKPTGPRFISIGVVAALGDPTGQAQADALGKWVKATLGKDTREQVFTDYEQLAKAVEHNDIHVAVMGPLAYLRIDPKTKARALLRTVRRGHSTYRSVLFAKPGSKLDSLAVLKKAKGLKVGWVDASSATGYLVPKATLLQNGIDPVQIFTVQDFAGSHDAVCKGVFEGKWDVGATFSDDARLETPTASGCFGALGQKAQALTIIAPSPAIPNDLLVVSPAFDASDAAKLADAARKLSSSAAGKKVLTQAFLAEGVDDVAAADFEPLRKALDAFHK